MPGPADALLMAWQHAAAAARLPSGQPVSQRTPYPRQPQPLAIARMWHSRAIRPGPPACANLPGAPRFERPTARYWNPHENIPPRLGGSPIEGHSSLVTKTLTDRFRAASGLTTVGWDQLRVIANMWLAKPGMFRPPKSTRGLTTPVQLTSRRAQRGQIRARVQRRGRKARSAEECRTDLN
ncbi:hypothetical protein MPTK2_2g17190 [Marchantia polymorpha subsp. ruderalis]